MADRAPRRPERADEGLHAAGTEEFWNESYYFDGVADDESLGFYARIGRLPNRDECVYSACVCRPGQPTLMLVETAPLPESDDEVQLVTTDRAPRSDVRNRSSVFT